MNAATQQESQALAIAPRVQFDLSPQTFEQALTFANYMAESDMVPKDFKGKPGNCLIAMQWGMEVGLKPLQALQGIAVINGRPSIWGDALLALVLSSPVCKDVQEYYEGQGESYTAVCVAKRHGRDDKVSTFSVKDAKDAGLLGKQGPWTQYRDRMLKQRARAFALRDQFADVIKGLAVAEEAMDIPGERHMGDVQMAPAGSKASEKADLAVWPDDALAARFPKYEKALADGHSHDQIIASAEQRGKLTEAQKQRIRELKPVEAKQAAKAQPDISDATPKATYAEVAAQLHAAKNVDELDDAGTLIGAVSDPQQRSELAAIFDQRSNELKA